MKVLKLLAKAVVTFLRKHWLSLIFLVYSLFSWWWVLDIDIASLATSSTVGNTLQIVVLVIATLISTGIYTISTKYLLKTLNKSKHWAIPFKLVVWWAATELFVAWAVCIIWYGVGGRIDNVLPFTSLSHFAIWTPLGYLSRFVGLYGLSGVVFMLIVIIIRRDLRKLIIPTILIIISSTALAWVIYRAPAGPKANVVIVTTTGLQERLPDTISPKNGSLVVLPEYSLGGFDDTTISDLIAPQKPDEKVYFVGTRIYLDQNKAKNQLVAGETSYGFTYLIDKNRLIPAGEYLPYAFVAGLKLTKSNDVIENFRNSRQIYKAEGIQKQPLLSFGDIKVGAGICSGIIAPEDYRILVKNGANILTNSAYLGVFNNSNNYLWHHQTMAKSMSIANARTFVQSTSSGPSFGFDSNGKRLFYEDHTAKTELMLSFNNKRTLYSLLGEYLAVIGLVWICVDVGYKIKYKVKRK